jgi:epsilon-lactone hydrolase
MPIGRFTKKIQCQLMAWVRMPPASDPLLDEARKLAVHAQDCGVNAQFELFGVDTHDFHIFWSFLPEAAQAVAQAGRFARDATLAAQAG